MRNAEGRGPPTAGEEPSNKAKTRRPCVLDPVEGCIVVATPWEMSQSPGLLQMLDFNERSARSKVKTSPIRIANSKAARRR